MDTDNWFVCFILFFHDYIYYLILTYKQNLEHMCFIVYLGIIQKISLLLLVKKNQFCIIYFNLIKCEFC